MITSFPLKLVDFKPGVECTNIGGVKSFGPPVGATILAQETRITAMTNVVIIRFLFSFSINVICLAFVYAKVQKNKVSLIIFGQC